MGRSINVNKTLQTYLILFIWFKTSDDGKIESGKKHSALVWKFNLCKLGSVLLFAGNVKCALSDSKNSFCASARNGQYVIEVHFLYFLNTDCEQ